jgi:hypothetical protein
MKSLWDPPMETQASGFRSAARRVLLIAERCSAARVGYAAANPPPTWLLCAVQQSRVIATAGSDGNQKQQFLRLAKAKTRL